MSEVQQMEFLCHCFSGQNKNHHKVKFPLNQEKKLIKESSFLILQCFRFNILLFQACKENHIIWEGKEAWILQILITIYMPELPQTVCSAGPRSDERGYKRNDV